MFFDFINVTTAMSLPLLDCMSALYSGRTYFMRPCDVTKAITSGTISLHSCKVKIMISLDKIFVS